MFKKLTIATLCLMFHAASSWATPMDYTFEIDFTDGSLAGTSSTVFVTLDDVTGVGYERFSPDSFFDGAILAFHTTVGGTVFTMADDRDYNRFPQIDLFDGAMSSVNFVAELGDQALTLSARGLINNVVYDPGGIIRHETGEVNLSSWMETTGEGVPAPATLTLFGLGIVGLGWSRRKRA